MKIIHTFTLNFLQPEKRTVISTEILGESSVVMAIVSASSVISEIGSEIIDEYSTWNNF